MLKLKLSIITLVLLLSACASPKVNYMTIREGVIPVKDEHKQSMQVEKVELGEVPESVVLEQSTIEAALEKNLAVYDLLNKESIDHKYNINLEMKFEYTGLIDITVTSTGKYIVTNLMTGNTLTFDVVEAYTAELTSNMFWSGLGRATLAGLGGAVVSQGLGANAQVTTAVATGAALSAASTVDEKYQAENITPEDKEILRQYGYCPDNVPYTALDGLSRTERAYEGSIRLNIASFIDQLYLTELPE